MRTRSLGRFPENSAPVQSLGASTTAATSGPPGQNSSENPPKSDADYWRARLLRRRYRFPASGESAESLAAYIDQGGVGYFFLLGTSDLDKAAALAGLIYRTVVSHGWHKVFQQYSRELIVTFEWCMNPVLWTYTTIHTLVGKSADTPPGCLSADAHRQRVCVVEADAGIRRALCWSIDQQAGFASVACESAESFAQAMADHPPRMVLANHHLAGRLGLKSAGMIAPIQPGVAALTYSVHVDGDQMFVSTPGGASGYLVKRIQPDRLLEPILSVTSRSELATDDFLLRVKYYFQELLQLHSGQDNTALARLTRREREVLGLLSKGCVDKEIAQAMGISIWTVHGYIKNIFEQLQVRTRTEAVIRYLEK